MTDVINLLRGLDPQALFLILVLLMAVRFFRTGVKESPIEFWHFYATKTKDGQDWTGEM